MISMFKRYSRHWSEHRRAHKAYISKIPQLRKASLQRKTTHFYINGCIVCCLQHYGCLYGFVFLWHQSKRQLFSKGKHYFGETAN